MGSDQFYAQLPALKNFTEVTDARNFTPVADDWHVIITDVKGSTKAIEAGRYKDVNTLGATSIIAIINIAKEIELPFAFGGDGASLLIPPSLVLPAKKALLATRDMARSAFQLDLRIGMLPISVVRQGGQNITVAKFQVSKHLTQAMFSGGGMAYAEKLIKGDATSALYEINDSTLVPEADFSGLECRWQGIRSKRGETVSLLVMATPKPGQSADRTYQEVIKRIENIYGDSSACRPVNAAALKMAIGGKALGVETRVRTYGKGGWWTRVKYLWTARLLTFASYFWMLFNVRYKDIHWGSYKSDVVANSDFRKFDDMLRMVLDGNTAQRARLTEYLQGEFQAGNLVYGIHVAEEALMTCLIFERAGNHAHFVDGADGGYALAAKELKSQIKERASIKSL